ncbi:MAG: FkbM family methyltransferase [Acidimicrobiales bacterium]
MRLTTHELLERAERVAATAARKLPAPAQGVLHDLRDRARADDATPAITLDDAARQAIAILNSPDKNLRYDAQTHAIIERVFRDAAPGAIGIDVGCHEGLILRHLLEAAPDIEHLAIEPLPHLAAHLRSTFPSVAVHEVALVAEPDGPLEFQHVTSNPGYSGIRQRAFDRPDETVETISVATAQLDDLVPAEAEVALLKVDVEGAELGVFQGARATLERCRPVVVFESGLGAADIYGTTPEDVHGFFSDLGMKVSLLGTWLEDGPALRKDQYVRQFQDGINFYFAAHPS